jgi:hypothetical protein
MQNPAKINNDIIVISQSYIPKCWDSVNSILDPVSNIFSIINNFGAFWAVILDTSDLLLILHLTQNNNG